MGKEPTIKHCALCPHFNERLYCEIINEEDKPCNDNEDDD